MSKYTPGPWSVFNHSWSDTTILAYGFEHGICSLDINHATEESQEEDEAQMAANARLIAAAPDLLDALEDLCERMEQIVRDDQSTPCTVKARAAIAKATGEQP